MNPIRTQQPQAPRSRDRAGTEAISPRKAVIGVVVVAAHCCRLLAGFGILSRMHADTVLAKTHRRAGRAHCHRRCRPSRARPSTDFVLPGNVTAFTDSPIYARTSRLPDALVLRHRRQVKKGALLAEIATPELDQQLAQAEADLPPPRPLPTTPTFRPIATLAWSSPTLSRSRTPTPSSIRPQPPRRRSAPRRPTCSGSRNCNRLRRSMRPSTAWSPRAMSTPAS